MNCAVECDSSSDEGLENDVSGCAGPEFGQEEKEKPVVLVTGFGPFGSHKVNSSCEAVKVLEKLGVGHEVKLVTRSCLPVVYKTILEEVPKLWEELKPQLVVHVGVSSRTEEVTLEKQAYNCRYFKGDINKKVPKGEVVVKKGADILKCGLDMETVRDDVNGSGCLAGIITSDNPGRYLCGFTYYLSMTIDPSRVSFVHLPPLDSPYTAQELGNTLRECVRAMMTQLGLRKDLSPPATVGALGASQGTPTDLMGKIEGDMSKLLDPTQ